MKSTREQKQEGMAPQVSLKCWGWEFYGAESSGYLERTREGRGEEERSP